MKVSDEVLAILSAAQCDGPNLVIGGKLEREDYARVAKVIEAAGGKWTRKAKAHVFDGDAAEAIEQVLLTGEITSAKQELGAFPSPLVVTERVIELASIHLGDSVLEPSAGAGALASAAVLRGGQVTCVEVQEKLAHALVASGRYIRVVHGDFLSMPPDALARFNVVVMNPPYAKQADIIHALHAIKFLRPGGRLVAVMSAGVKLRQDRRARDFRELIARFGAEIEDLPPGSFKESGTMVNAVIVSFNV